MPTSTLEYNHVYILMCFFLGITLIGKSPLGKGDLPMVGKNLDVSKNSGTPKMDGL